MSRVHLFHRLRSSAGRLVPALRNRNYRLFFFGNGASLIGTWMQRIALSWLVYRLTGSEFLLGVVGFSSQILSFLGAPVAGVLADRTNRLRLLLATQSLAMVQAFLLAALTLTNAVAIWEIIALSMLLGLVNAFDIPIRQSFVVEMIESRDDLPNAIALNSFLVNSAKLLGPSIAGVLIVIIGEGLCFLLNGVSFLAVIAALLVMTVNPDVRPKPTDSVLANLRDGIAYSYACLPIRLVLMLLAFVSLFGLSITVLMPVIAKDILHGGPDTLGFLMAASGVGAILGAVLMAAWSGIVRLPQLIAGATGLLGVSLLGLAFARTFPVTLFFLMLMGFATLLMLASINTFLQRRVDDDKRGRVMSFYTMAFMGMAPFGSLLAGGLASILTTPWAIATSGAGALLATAVFTLGLPHFDRDQRALEAAGVATSPRAN